MKIIAIKIRRKPRTANIASLDEYLKSTTILPPPHDYNTVLSQANMDGTEPPWPTGFTKLNAGSYFIKGFVQEEIDTETGLTNRIFTYYVDITEDAVKDITLENAYENLRKYKSDYAKLVGLAELDAWINDYTDQNYTESFTTSFDESDLAYDWVLDHKVTYRDPCLSQ
jgi:hypothetical protein